MPFEHGVGHAHAVNVPAIGVVDDRGDGVFDRELSLFGNDLSNATANRRVRRLSAYSTVFS